MAFYKKINFNDKADIFVWKISEDLETLKANVILKPESLERYNGMKSESHKKGFLAVRMLLQYCGYTDYDLIYDLTGKPFLVDGKFISITHSFDFSVISIGTESLGIDIELKRDKVLRIANKFSDEDFMNPDIDKGLQIKLYTMIWGAKESIFKIVNEPGISFIDHIKVAAFDFKENETKAVLRWRDTTEDFFIFFKEIENYVLVYACR